MAFRPHVFIGQDVSGDAYLFRVLGGEAGTRIYAWSREDDSRTHHAYRLREHLTAHVEALCSELP